MSFWIHCGDWLEQIYFLWSGSFRAEIEYILIGLLRSGGLERVEEVISSEIYIKLLGIEWLDLPVVLLPGKGQATRWRFHRSGLTFLTELHTATLRHRGSIFGRIGGWNRNCLESSLWGCWFARVLIEIWLQRWCCQALEQIRLQSLNLCRLLGARRGIELCSTLVDCRRGFSLSYFGKRWAELVNAVLELGIFNLLV